MYESKEGQVRLDVHFEQESVLLTQRQMSEVFRSTPENVLMHLRNIFSSNKLDAEATTKDFLVVRSEGNRSVRRGVKRYKLGYDHAAYPQCLQQARTGPDINLRKICTGSRRMWPNCAARTWRRRYWTHRCRKQWREWRLRGAII